MSALLELPSTRDEAWRWADLDTLRSAAEAPHAAAATDPATLFLDIPGLRLLFVDGRFEPAHSRPGKVEIGAIVPDTAHPLGAQAAGEGWRLSLGAEQTTGTVQIVHLSTGGTSAAPARIDLAEDAVASVVETFAGPAGWINAVTQATLGHAARLMRAIRIVQDTGFVSLREEATLGEGASLVTTVLGAGGAGARIDGAIVLEGEGGFAEFGGALLVAGEQRQECAVAVRHAAPLGSSRQVWRAVAADRAQASLAARVEVARHAQKTDGEQSLRGLLLQRTATVNLKPELEIFADDVKCAHGATVGELDPRALFYLESRGIPDAQAKALLTHAFVADALDRIGDETVRDAFVADADAWLEKAL